MLSLFIKGLIIGLAIAAPVGPIGILCIQRSLRYGFRIGFMTGMGAATADGLYGLVAAFGLTAISTILMSHQFWIRIVGGLFLIYLGIKLFLTKPSKEQTKNNSDHSAWHSYATTIFLTLTNPMTILSFMAIFAGLGLGSQHNDYAGAMLLVFGIFIGSLLWWIFLSGGVAYVLHHRITSASMKIINRISGSILLLFGLWALKIVLSVL